MCKSSLCTLVSDPLTVKFIERWLGGGGGEEFFILSNLWGEGLRIQAQEFKPTFPSPIMRIVMHMPCYKTN